MSYMGVVAFQDVMRSTRNHPFLCLSVTGPVSSLDRAELLLQMQE